MSEGLLWYLKEYPSIPAWHCFYHLVCDIYIELWNERICPSLFQETDLLDITYIKDARTGKCTKTPKVRQTVRSITTHLVQKHKSQHYCNHPFSETQRSVVDLWPLYKCCLVVSGFSSHPHVNKKNQRFLLHWASLTVCVCLSLSLWVCFWWCI